MTDQPRFYARAIPADLAVDEDAGTAEGLLVPYGVRTPIVERRGDELVHYVEEFAPGAFDRARRAPGRIPYTYGHSHAFGDRLGVFTHLEDREQGLWGRIKLDPSKVDAARDAMTSSHQSISIGFLSVVPKPFSEHEGSHVIRRSAVLDHVAAVPEGAYADARLLVVRNLTDEDLEETDADRAARAELDAQAELLRSVHELIDAGQRWAGIAGYRAG
jgi:HK97 family phage prohead protease